MDFIGVKKRGAFLNIFRRMIHSLYDFEAYKIFINKGSLKSVGYFFSLIVILSIIPMFILVNSVVDELNQLTRPIEEQLPDFSIEKGILKVDIDKPTMIRGNDIGIVLDPNEKLARADYDHYPYSFKITKKEWIALIHGKEIMSIPYDSNMNFKKIDLINNIYISKLMAPIIIPIAGVVLLFISNMITSLMYATGVMLFNLFMRVNLNFNDVYTITLHAMTLSLIISMLLITFDIRIQMIELLYAVITLSYAHIVLRHIKSSRIETMDLDKR